MDIRQVQSFKITTSLDDLVRDFRRNPFANEAREAFIFECRNYRGEEKYKLCVLESTAQLSLQRALELQQKNPDLVCVQVEKLTTGTVFNYPIAQF
jgi:hypothetical protein